MWLIFVALLGIPPYPALVILKSMYLYSIKKHLFEPLSNWKKTCKMWKTVLNDRKMARQSKANLFDLDWVGIFW